MKGQRITKHQLRKGLYIKLPLRWHEHPFLRSTFEIQTVEEVALIKRLPVDFLLYFPEKSSSTPKLALEIMENKDAEPEPSKESVLELSVELHKKKQQQINEMSVLRTRQAECENKYKQSMLLLRKGIEEFRRNPQRSCGEIKDLSASLAEIASSGPLTLHLIDKPLTGDDHFFHTLNVSIFCAMMAKQKGFSKEQTTELLMGGMLHDIGMIDLSQPFSADGKVVSVGADMQKEQHPIKGAKMVEHYSSVSLNTRNIIQNHHEYYDGSGFPIGLKGDELDEMSQIVSLSNMYDDLCQPQRSGKAYQPSSAVSLLYKTMKSKFRPDLLEQFVKMIGIYPPGTIVVLSDQSVGMVLSNSAETLLKPNVVIYDPMIPRDQATLLQLNDTELTVKQVIKPKSVPQHIYDYLCPSSKFYYFFDTSE